MVRRGDPASWIVRAVLVLGFGLALAMSWPGHLTFDSVAQLAEGAAGAQQTWGPALFSWLLGVSHRLGGDAGPYLAASVLLVLASFWALTALAPRVSWWGVPAALLVMASPALAIYQGIVWKDVLFANLTVAGFVALAWAAAARRPAVRWTALAASALALAAACLARQNGLLVVAAAALTVGWLARGAGWLRAGAAAAGAFAAVFLLAQLIHAGVQPPGADPGRRTDIGLRILLHYDILGAAAHDPQLELREIAAVRPQAAALIRERAPAAYSPERVDEMEADPELVKSFWRTPAPVVLAQWRQIATSRPDLYLAHRWAAFRQVFLTPDLQRCLPVAAGVTGAPQHLAAVGLAAGRDARDERLIAYAGRFFDTPFYSHAAYAALAAVLIGLLLLRRRAADTAIAGLMAAGLAVAASYFAISIACDYRYLYVLDLAALTGLLYFALDPRLRRAG